MTLGEIGGVVRCVAECSDQTLHRPARRLRGELLGGERAQPPPEELGSREPGRLHELLQQITILSVQVDLNRLSHSGGGPASLSVHVYRECTHAGEEGNELEIGDDLAPGRGGAEARSDR